MSTNLNCDKNKNIDSFKKLLSLKFFPYLLFFLAIITVYSGSIMFSVTELDDAVLVERNYEYLNNPYNIISSFFKSTFNSSSDFFYRPILTISWILDTLIGGNRLWVHHLFDVFYHFFAVCILFSLLKKLDISHYKALIFTSFFAILPILNQAVSWMPGRNDSLLAIFIFSSFIFLIEYNICGDIKNIFLAVLLFLCALYTKESAVAALFVFPVYLFVYKKNASIKKNVLCFGLFLIGCFIWYLMKKTFTITGEMNLYHFVSYTKTAVLKFFPATLQYISKIFFPINLKVMPHISFFDSIAGLIISVFMGIAIYKSEKVDYKNIFFGLFWFIFFLVLPYFQPTPFILEHRVYTAMPGLILILNEINLKSENKKVFPFFLALYFVFFIAISFINNAKFANKLNFACAAVTETPNDVKTYYLYGRRFLDNATYQTGNYFMNKNLNKLSLKEKKKEIFNCGYLGIFAWQRGDIKTAKKYLTIAAEGGDETMHQVYAVLSDIYYKEGRYEDSLKNIKKAFKQKPDNSEYYRYLKLVFNAINNKK